METKRLNNTLSIILGADNSGQDDLCDLLSSLEYNIEKEKSKDWCVVEMREQKITDFGSTVCVNLKPCFIENLFEKLQCNENHVNIHFFMIIC